MFVDGLVLTETATISGQNDSQVKISGIELPAAKSITTDNVNSAVKIAGIQLPAEKTISTDNAAPVKIIAKIEIPYDIGGSMSAAVEADEIVSRFVAVRGFTTLANFAGSRANAPVAAEATAIFSIQKNGVEVATFSFVANATQAVFSTAALIAWVAGDVLTVVAAEADPTMTSMNFTLSGLVFETTTTTV